MERFAKIVNSFTLLIIFAKKLILDILRGSEYASESIQCCKVLWKSFSLFQILLKYKVLGQREKNELVSKAKLLVQYSILFNYNLLLLPDVPKSSFTKFFNVLII